MPLISTLGSVSARGYGEFLSSGTTFELIESATVGSGGSSQILFSNIPDTYKHLRIIGNARTTQSGTSGSAILMQFNGDTGSNYWTHRLYATGTTKATDGSSAANAFPQVGNGASAGLDANLWQPNLIDIVDYRSNKNKTVRSLSGGDWVSNAGYFMYNDAYWTGTAAITQIKIFHQTDNLAQNTIMSLYGMRG